MLIFFHTTYPHGSQEWPSCGSRHNQRSSRLVYKVSKFTYYYYYEFKCFWNTFIKIAKLYKM